MKVFVTGVTGFIGFHVARLLLEKGFDVCALLRKESDVSFMDSLDVEWVIGDLRDLESVSSAPRGCGQVYHIAADYRLWVPDPKNMYDINVGGTRNVMQAAMMKGIEKAVYTSTAGVLAAGSSDKSSHEETPSSLDEMVGDGVVF